MFIDERIADDLKKAHDDGMWEMFELITSAWYGKRRFYEEPSGIVYDRSKSDYLKNKNEAIDRFLHEIGDWDM